jgi:hypothetical protein
MAGIAGGIWTGSAGGSAPSFRCIGFDHWLVVILENRHSEDRRCGKREI